MGPIRVTNILIGHHRLATRPCPVPGPATTTVDSPSAQLIKRLDLAPLLSTSPGFPRLQSYSPNPRAAAGRSHAPATERQARRRESLRRVPSAKAQQPGKQYPHGPRCLDDRYLLSTIPGFLPHEHYSPKVRINLHLVSTFEILTSLHSSFF